MYLVLKLVHLIGVVLFLGNISIGVFWKNSADRTGNPAVMAYTMRSIIQADRVFTIPGLILILLGGFATAAVGHISILGTGWILWALVMLVISGLAFGPLSRVQRELFAVAERATTDPSQLVAYKQLSEKFNVWGLVALVTPIIAFVLMILKPLLPAFHRG